MKLRELFEETVEGDVQLLGMDVTKGELNVAYKDIILNGNFNCRECYSLKSLKNTPKEVNGDCDFCNCTDIVSIEGIGKDFLCVINGELVLPPYIEKGFLGLLKIRGCKNISMNSFANDNTKKAMRIINSHIKDKNLRKCKLELEEAGLSEFAKL